DLAVRRRPHHSNPLAAGVAARGSDTDWCVLLAPEPDPDTDGGARRTPGMEGDQIRPERPGEPGVLFGHAGEAPRVRRVLPGARGISRFDKLRRARDARTDACAAALKASRKAEVGSRKNQRREFMFVTFRNGRMTAALISLLVLVSLPGDVLAQTKPRRAALDGAPPASILWVGNSFFYYNNSMHNYVGAMVRAADPKMTHRGTSATISGSGFDWHDMESYFRPDGIGKYSFVGDNEVRFNKLEKLFDVVIMSDCSQCPVHPKLKPVFHDYAKKQSDIVRKHG